MKPKVPKPAPSVEASNGTTSTADPRATIVASMEKAAGEILTALFLGDFAEPTSTAEMAKRCPTVWQQAVQVLGGRQEDAREWMDSPCALLGNEKPFLVALRSEGARAVSQALDTMDRQARRRLATVSEYYLNPLKVKAPRCRFEKIGTKRQYAHALARIRTLRDAKAGTAKGRELNWLIGMVEKYEKHMFGL